MTDGLRMLILDKDNTSGYIRGEKEKPYLKGMTIWLRSDVRTSERAGTVLFPPLSYERYD